MKLSFDELLAETDQGALKLSKNLEQLEAKGMIRRRDDGSWELTDWGRQVAREFERRRMS